MAQHDYELSNQSGAAFRSDLNNALSAIATLNSGSSEPSPSFAFQLWADTTTSKLKIRNSSNTSWVIVGELNSENLGLTDLVQDSSPQLGGNLDVQGFNITSSAPSGHVGLSVNLSMNNNAIEDCAGININGSIDLADTGDSNTRIGQITANSFDQSIEKPNGDYTYISIFPSNDMKAVMELGNSIGGHGSWLEIYMSDITQIPVLSCSAQMISFSSAKIIDVADPTSDQHAATKKYVDDKFASVGGSSPVDSSLSGTNVDWSVGDTFYKSISSNTVFTFSNTSNAKTISVILKNTSASDITVTFPTCLTSGILPTTIASGKESLFTFTKSNNKIYAGALTDMA